MSESLRIGMIGYAFMGAAHSYGWRNCARAFDLPLAAELTAIAGRDIKRVTQAAHRLGWDGVETDWRRLLERDDIDVIDICSPGDTHAEIAIAALRAGKHVLCEKPLANSVMEAQQMAQAADEAAANGVLAMCGFTYRRQPALALARRIMGEGRLGEVRHVRVQYLQDWLRDPLSPFTWRMDVERAGSGALGDLGAHAVDVAQWLLGSPIHEVTALLETFIDERPKTGGDGTGSVTVDDAALLLGRFVGGAVATFELSRFATGRKNALRVEINGSQGSLAFDLERNNELHYFDARDCSELAGFRRILVTEPSHPYLTGWWPPGHTLGYDHGFVNQAADFVDAVARGRQPEPSFADAFQVQRVLGAALDSATTGSWQSVLPAFAAG